MDTHLLSKAGCGSECPPFYFFLENKKIKKNKKGHPSFE